jgi:hypothetical protein
MRLIVLTERASQWEKEEDKYGSVKICEERDDEKKDTTQR